MSLLKALLKTTCEGINQHHYKKSVNKAKKNASKNTRIAEFKAKRKGNKFNAKATYCKFFYPALEKAKNRKELFSTFINNV